MRWIALCAALSLSVLAACTESSNPSAEPAKSTSRLRSEPIEWVGLELTWDIDSDADFDEFMEPIFGERAANGEGHEAFELQPGLLLNVVPDTRTPEQVVISLDMAPSVPTSADIRRVLEVPASLEYGRVFIEAVHVAMDKAVIENAKAEGSMKPFYLQYRTRSDMGGFFEIEAKHENGQTQLHLTARTPETSLLPGEINTPAFAGEPTESLGGTVLFSLGRDEFEFFSNRAYGITAGADQNFKDFRLLPHEWLRLTVTPRLADELVDVGFEVITRDGQRVPFAKAPASILAGEQFQQHVFRLIDNMLEQEAEAPGSSGSFKSQFHYDDPEGGGVVRVIFLGDRGDFQVAYTVESPVRRLQDVQYVPYVATVEIPDELPVVETSCDELGSVDALSGVFKLRFDASSTVRESANLEDELIGHIWGSVFRDEDVTLSGPNEGAVAVASFAYEDVDIRDGASMEFVLDEDIPAGDYQILGFMDIDVNADPGSPTADTGDPVTLPIGAYELRCAEQPVVVEFALLRPEGA